jgi:hypothetical protein
MEQIQDTGPLIGYARELGERLELYEQCLAALQLLPEIEALAIFRCAALVELNSIPPDDPRMPELIQFIANVERRLFGLDDERGQA